MHLTIDEILDAVKYLNFSSRQVFFDNLKAIRTLNTGEKVSIAWPDIIIHLNIEEWNHAYNTAIGNLEIPKPVVTKTDKDNCPRTDDNNHVWADVTSYGEGKKFRLCIKCNYRETYIGELDEV
jgi:hypothetical protein